MHRCRECRQEWQETSKGRVPTPVSAREPTEVVEVDDPAEEERELDETSHLGSSHVGSPGTAKPSMSRYIPRSVLNNVRTRAYSVAPYSAVFVSRGSALSRE